MKRQENMKVASRRMDIGNKPKHSDLNILKQQNQRITYLAYTHHLKIQVSLQICTLFDSKQKIDVIPKNRSFYKFLY